MQELIQTWFQGLFEGFYPIFDVIFIIITFFGEETFLICLLAIMFWGVDKKLGTKLACASLLSCNVNDTIKNLANVERPISDEAIRYVDYDGVFVSTHLESSSFPSGHSQNAGSLFGTMGFHFNKKKVWILCIIAIVLICLSRLYLGVHWPLDVSVGSVLGLTIAYFFSYIYDKYEDKKLYIFISVIVITLLLMIVTHTASSVKTSGATIGAMLGLIFECKLVNFDEKKGTWYQRLIRVLIGLGLVFAMKAGLKPLFNLIGEYKILDFIRYALMTFVGVGLYPLCFKKFREKYIKEDKSENTVVSNNKKFGLNDKIKVEENQIVETKKEEESKVDFIVVDDSNEDK